MSDSNVQTEIERLYESESMTDELPDTEAETLLNWGSSQIKHLAQHSQDLESDSKRLRQLIKYINRFVGQREFMDTDQQLEELESVVKWAKRLKIDITEQQVQEALQPIANMATDLDAILPLVNLAPTPASAAQETQPAPNFSDSATESTPQSENNPATAEENSTHIEEVAQTPFETQSEDTAPPDNSFGARLEALIRGDFLPTNQPDETQLDDQDTSTETPQDHHDMPTDDWQTGEMCADEED